MSYNGSGTFVVNSSGQPVVTGTVISSTAFNALTADLATGLSTAITKDGQTTTTARILFAQGVSSTLVTDATSATTGSIITAGGISMQKALWVGTTATIAGATTMAGITATSLALGGATLGTNALAVTGSSLFPGSTTITAAGLVGIGMTPSNVLDITQTQNGQSLGSILNSNAGGNANAKWFATNGTNWGTVGVLGQSFTTSGAYVAGYGFAAGNTGMSIIAQGGPILFASNGTAEVARFDTSGRLQVGTTAGTGRINMANSGGGLHQINSAGVDKEILNLFSDDNLYFTAPSNIIIRPGGGGEAARFDTSGNLLVGTTSNATTSRAVFRNTQNVLALDNAGGQYTTMTFCNNNTAAAYVFYDNTNSRLYVQTGGSGGVYLAATGTSWTAVSDERVKDIIEPIENATEKLAGWRTVVGKYKTDKDGVRRSFLIAQDILKTFPEAVDATNTDEYGVNYQDTIPVLVAAIQELTTRLAALENK